MKSVGCMTLIGVAVPLLGAGVWLGSPGLAILGFGFGFWACGEWAQLTSGYYDENYVCGVVLKTMGVGVPAGALFYAALATISI